jgi:outer membrane protein OmpA-like peptidoglycan-associated protein
MIRDIIYKNILVSTVLLLPHFTTLAQDKKKSNDDMLKKMQELMSQASDSKSKYKGIDSLQKAKMQEYQTKSYAQQGGGSTTLYRTYDNLSAAEKEQIKDLPMPPKYFRTDKDVIDFASKTKSLDIKSKLMQQGSSLQVKGFLISYMKQVDFANAMVKNVQKAKKAFEEKNPNMNYGANQGKAYISNADVVYLPLGDASFADEVVSANFGAGKLKFEEKNCLSTPDYEEGLKVQNNKGIYNLGLNGELIIKFTDNALIDVAGDDLYIFELGQVEPTQLYISKDGTDWIDVGKISGGISHVDIHDKVKPNEYYFYVKLKDLNTNSTVPGADIDAVATIGGAMKLDLNAQVLFETGQAKLKPEGIKAITALALKIKTTPRATINVSGYTDNVGAEKSNQTLSEQRASEVSNILMAELKSGNYSYQQKGMGSRNPIASNNTEDGRQKNRRVEIVIAPY